MVFNRERILFIWGSRYKIDSFEQQPEIAFLSSSSYKHGSYLCPVCNTWVSGIVRVKNRWACAKCNNARIGRGRGRTAMLYRITNDLIEYLGEEITSEQLDNCDLMKGFLKFSRIEERLNEFLLFVKFLRMIKKLKDKERSMSVIELLVKLVAEQNRTSKS